MKIVLTFCLLLIASPVYAGKFWPIPECPYTGHATCSDGKDNDVDGTKDEAAPSAAFSAVTGGYAANAAECQLLTYAATADAESDSGDMAEKTGSYRTGQIACSGNFTSDTYYVWLRLRIASGTAESKRVVWADTSPFQRSFQNDDAALPFITTNGISSSFAWTKLGEGLNFAGIASSNTVNPNSTAHKSIALNGNAVIYLTADEAVKFDGIFLSTNPDATPISPSAPTPTPPQAGAITVSGVTTSSFTASWDFDTNSTDDGDCFLNYSTTQGSLTSQTATAASSSGTCSRTPTGLDSGTIYYMRGTSTSADGTTQTPQTQIQTSVQTTGPIRLAVASGGVATGTCLVTACTLTYAISQAVAGDTVQLADGVYVPTSKIVTVRAGTASQPITITAENEHLAIVRPASNIQQMIDIKHSYITVKNIEWDGNNVCCTDGIRVLPGAPPTAAITGIILENNRVINTNGNSIIWTGNVDGFTYRWNYLNRTTFAGSGEGFYLGSASGSGNASNGQIYANTIIDSTQECWDIKTGDAGNFIHHNICDGSGRLTTNGTSALGSTATYGPITIQSSAGTNNRFEDNIIKNFKVRDNGGGGAMLFSGSNNFITRNVFRDQLFGNKKLSSVSGTATATSNTFCSFLSNTIDGGWTLVTNSGAPGADAADTACDSEETRILAEMQDLPGNPDAGNPGGGGGGTTDAIVYLTFDENTGTTAADSSTGGENDGTLVNGATWATGKNGSGVSLDGTDDHVKLGTTNMTAGAGTVTFWVKPTSFGAGTHYFYGHTTIPAYASRIQLYFDDTGGNLDLGLGDTHTRSLGLLDMAVDTWYHLGLTWDSGTWILYVNGAQASTGSYTGLSEVGGYQHVGNTGNDAQIQSAAAVIDEFKVWNRALTSGEITTEYNIFGP